MGLPSIKSKTLYSCVIGGIIIASLWSVLFLTNYREPIINGFGIELQGGAISGSSIHPRTPAIPMSNRSSTMLVWRPQISSLLPYFDVPAARAAGDYASHLFYGFYIPLWIPLIPTIIILYLVRPRPFNPNLCRHCSYPIIKIHVPHPTCPECGH